MAKCRMLLQENEELGKMITSGRTAKLEGEIALQKTLVQEMKKNQQGIGIQQCIWPHHDGQLVTPKPFRIKVHLMQSFLGHYIHSKILLVSHAPHLYK